MQPDRQRTRELAQPRQAGIVIFRHDTGKHALAPDVHDVGHLRRLHIVGAGRLGVANQLDGGLEVGRWRQARAHLDEADGEGRGCTHVGPPCVMPSAASNGSSPPARCSAYRSSQPPIWVEPTKICGTVLRPLARSIILPRSCGSPLTSISKNLIPWRVRSALAEWQKPQKRVV